MSTDKSFKKIGIVGYGLVGSSICGLIEKYAPDTRLVIVETNCTNRDFAIERHTSASVYVDISDVRDCDLVIVCTYVRDIAQVIGNIFEVPGFSGLVLDAGSVKKEVVDQVLEKTSHADRYIPGHPMAGRNASGPQEGSYEIMAGQRFLLSEHPKMTLSNLTAVEAFLSNLSFKTKIISVERHDEILSLTSHFPHVLAYMLGHQLNALASRVPTQEIEALSGRSIRTLVDFSSPNTTMWEQILIANKANILAAGSSIISTLEGLLEAVENEDEEALRAVLAEGAKGRALLLP
jgi:prephenate dehydrogenase